MIKLRQNRYYLSLNTLEIKSSNKELCALFFRQYHTSGYFAACGYDCYIQQ